MDHALAVVGATNAAKELVREAGKLAAGVDAQLTLIHVTTEDEYEEQRMQMEQISGYNASYSVTQARDGAENFAADIGRETLDGIDVDWDAVGALGDSGRKVLTEAERLDCDHVFATGDKRSPTGKALFGDDTQRLILDFEGPVTVLTV